MYAFAVLVQPVGSLVDDGDGQPLVQERVLPEPGDQGVVGVHRGLEDVRAGEEGHRGAGLVGRLVLVERGDRVAEHEVLAPAVAVPLDVHREGGRQRVHHRDADAVQATGDLVAAVAELAAGMQHGQRQGHRRDLLLGMLLDRDAAAVVDDLDPPLGQDPDEDGVAVAGQRLVDGVVDHLVHQVVQAALPGGADVHAGTLADRVETLEHRDGLGVVAAGGDGGGTDLVEVTGRGGQFLGRDADVGGVDEVVVVGLLGRGGHLVRGLLSHARRPDLHPIGCGRRHDELLFVAVVSGLSRPATSLPAPGPESVRSSPTWPGKSRLGRVVGPIWRIRARSG